MIQTEWYCDKCKTSHFGNCPQMTVTMTTNVSAPRYFRGDGVELDPKTRKPLPKPHSDTKDNREIDEINKILIDFLHHIGNPPDTSLERRKATKAITKLFATQSSHLLDTLLEAMPKKRTRKPRPPYMSGGKLTNVYTDDFIEQGYNQAIQDMLDKLTKL